MEASESHTDQPIGGQAISRVIRYSAESPLRRPGPLIVGIFTDFWRYRELISILFVRDLKAQYRQSILGYVWLFIPILSTTIVWMFLNSTKVIEVAETSIPYPAYVLLGTMIWGLFTSSVNQPLASFTSGQAVFMKLKVPPEAFILAGISRIVFDLVIRLIVLIPVFLLFDITPAATGWLFPVGLFCAIIIGLSIGFLIIPLGSLYSDVGRIVSTALGFGMYLTPIVYPPPESGWAATLINWNPLTSVVMVTRDWLTIGNSPYLGTMLVTVVVALLVLLIALVIFRVTLPHLIERMGM